MPNVTTMTRTEQRRASHARRGADRSRQQISRLLHVLHDHAHGAVRLEGKQKQSEKDLKDLREQNRDEASLTLYRKSILRTVLVGLLAVYAIDFLVVRAAADFLIALGFYHLTPWVNNLLLMIFPAGLIVLELVISEQSEEAKEEGQPRGARLLWVMIGLILALVIPALGVATYLISMKTKLSGNPLPLAHQILLLGLVCLSLVAHVSVIFGGALSRDARVYLWFSLKSRRLQRDIKQAETGSRRATDAVGRTFINYGDALERHNNEYPESRVGGGPFDNDARTFVRRLFGDDAIQQAPQTAAPNQVQERPGANQELPANEQHRATPQATPPSAEDPERVTSPNGHHHTDDDYYRTIVEEQIRNAEGEVRL